MGIHKSDIVCSVHHSKQLHCINSLPRKMGSTKATCPVQFSGYSLRQSNNRHMYLELIAEVFIYDAFNKNVHLRKVNNRGGRSANKFRK